MPEFFTMLVALLAAVGTVSFVWLLLRVLLRSDATGAPVYAVVRLSEQPPLDVQGIVRRLRWMRQWGAADLRIILVDDDTPDETRMQVEILQKEYPALILCAVDEIQEWLR